MTTIAQEKARIAKIQKHDKQSSDKVSDFYVNALTVISQHLNDFYNRYADDTGLPLSQVTQSVNTWDMNMYRTAINTLLLTANPDDDLTRQIQTLYAQAALSKKDMLNSLIGAGVAVATNQAQQYGIDKLNKEFAEGYNLRGGNNLTPQEIANSNQESLDQFQNRLAMHQTLMTTEMQQTLARGLQGGLNQNDLNRLTYVPSDITRTKHQRRKPSLSSALATALTGVIVLGISQSSISNSKGAMKAFKEDKNVDYVFWLTEGDDRVCDLCDSISDSNPFDLDDAPQPVISTHANCRCQLLPCDKDGTIK